MIWLEQQARRIGRRALFAGLTLLVALPVYGPLIVPNYLQWQHYHHHIFLGEVDFSHSHDHVHLAAPTTCLSLLPWQGNCADYHHHHTLSFPRLDGLWQLIPLMCLPLGGLAITPRRWLLSPRPALYYGLSRIWIQPPEKPPRFLSLTHL